MRGQLFCGRYSIGLKAEPVLLAWQCVVVQEGANDETSARFCDSNFSSHVSFLSPGRAVAVVGLGLEAVKPSVMVMLELMEL